MADVWPESRSTLEWLLLGLRQSCFFRSSAGSRIPEPGENTFRNILPEFKSTLFWQLTDLSIWLESLFCVSFSGSCLHVFAAGLTVCQKILQAPAGSSCRAIREGCHFRNSVGFSSTQKHTSVFVLWPLPLSRICWAMLGEL